MGLARKKYNPDSQTVLHPMLNPLQKRLVWLAAFCYLVLQGFVPAGYMPSFGLGASATPFVLCHGDNASAQWLNVQQNASLNHLTSQDSPSDHASFQSTAGSNKDSTHHSVNFDCSFSSFYLTQVLESLARYPFVLNRFIFIAALPPHIFSTKKPSFQLQARAPPLLMICDIV